MLAAKRFIPITSRTYIRKRGYGLGQDDSSITGDISNASSTIGTVSTNITQSAASIAAAFNALGGNTTSWIPAQNNAASQLASIVSNYINVKTAGQLTGQYIATAINQVNAVVAGFKQFVGSQSYSSSNGAQNGVNAIQQNGNAIIANMQLDAANLGLTLSTTVNSAGQSVVTSSLLSGSTLYIVLGIAALVLLPRFLPKG